MSPVLRIVRHETKNITLEEAAAERKLTEGKGESKQARRREAKQLASLSTMPVADAVTSWETGEYTREAIRPAEGVAGWMGFEKSVAVKGTRPTQRALTTQRFYDELPIEARQQFDLYREAKQVGASPEVLAEGERLYRLKWEEHREREATRARTQVRGRDEALLRAMRAAAQPNHLQL